MKGKVGRKPQIKIPADPSGERSTVVADSQRAERFPAAEVQRNEPVSRKTVNPSQRPCRETTYAPLDD